MLHRKYKIAILADMNPQGQLPDAMIQALGIQATDLEKLSSRIYLGRSNSLHAFDKDALEQELGISQLRAKNIRSSLEIAR